MTVPTCPVRQTADLDDYPDLVVIYLGLRARTPRGLLAIFLDMPPVGFTAVAPVVDARRCLLSARRRLRLAGGEATAPPVSEHEFYGSAR